jgi:hypothetical protein
VLQQYNDYTLVALLKCNSRWIIYFDEKYGNGDIGTWWGFLSMSDCSLNFSLQEYF